MEYLRFDLSRSISTRLTRWHALRQWSRPVTERLLPFVSRCCMQTHYVGGFHDQRAGFILLWGDASQALLLRGIRGPVRVDEKIKEPT
jgi:hypothetical protein